MARVEDRGAEQPGQDHDERDDRGLLVVHPQHHRDVAGDEHGKDREYKRLPPVVHTSNSRTRGLDTLGLQRGREEDADAENRNLAAPLT